MSSSPIGAFTSTAVRNGSRVMRYASNRVDDQPVRTIAPTVKFVGLGGGRRLARPATVAADRPGIVTTPAALAALAVIVGGVCGVATVTVRGRSSSPWSVVVGRP